MKKRIPFFLRQAVIWPASIAAMLIIIFGIVALLKNESQSYTDKPITVADKTTPLVNKPIEKQKEITNLPQKFPITETKGPDDKSFSLEKGPSALANAGDAEFLDDPKIDLDNKNGPMFAKQVDVAALQMISFTGQLPGSYPGTTLISDRFEMSSAFEYMIIRDAMNEEFEMAQKKKSTVGRIFANLGNKIFGGLSTESPSMFKNITNKGKASFNELAEALPVYSESYDSGRKNTYFALSENLKFRISKNKNMQEVENRNGAN